MTDGATPPGWYAAEDGIERWWDGRGWTAYTRPAPGAGAGAAQHGGEAAGPAAPGPDGAPVAIATTPRPRNPRGHGFAIAALVLAIVAAGLSGLTGYGPTRALSFLPALLAIVFGILVLARRSRLRGLAIAGLVIGALVLVSNASSAVVGLTAPAPTASAAQEHRYLDAAIDAIAVGVGGQVPEGGQRTEAHARFDQQLLTIGYQTCRDVARGVPSATLARNFVTGFTRSGGSTEAARAVGRRITPVIGRYLCPDHLADLQQVAAAF